MQVTVKLVIFPHPQYPVWSKYCSYCPELRYFFGRGDSVAVCINEVREHLLRQLRRRFKYRNLKICNWEITENLVIPPTFTNEQAVKLTEKSYEIAITDYQIIEITVVIPAPTDD